MASSLYSDNTIEVSAPNVSYTEDHIKAEYVYETTDVEIHDNKVVATPLKEKFHFKTDRKVPRTGMMIVGLGGNNGTTVTASILANRNNVQWRDRHGVRKPNYLGSVTHASTVRLGARQGRDVYVPMNKMLPMVHPNDLVIGGWDISSMNLGDAMARAEVLPYDLQRQLYDEMKEIKPLPSIYSKDFIAENQEERADNVLKGNKEELVEKIRQQIRDFKAKNQLDKVVVLWSANTERFSDVREGLNMTSSQLMNSIKKDEDEVSPSTLFAVASILEGCTYINGSPQNTFVPGVLELAEQKDVFIAGDDFKSGQTKMKSVLVDFLVSAGLKPVSIVSYNHLGNNDGKNLSSPKQFRSKEISKSNVVDDMVASNRMMFKENEHPDHCVVIKYVPYVGDSKRAMDEYTSEIFMNGSNTITMHNVCEDSLLASPLIIDLVVLGELCERIHVKKEGEQEYSRFHSVLSILSYLLKAPMTPPGTPVVNALFKQREAVLNVLRACIGLPAENHMLLEHRISTAGKLAAGGVPVDTRGGFDIVAGTTTDKAPNSTNTANPTKGCVDEDSGEEVNSPLEVAPHN
eukprot:gb/GECG01006216.1/.p1 GENE.gb/GECG01006216.1/~~gb/GECG01006216.1/.p1  ORF type:complete len:575 (+),score=98.16 gb/GECG01006216.1/:1-1725(+)